MERSVQTPIAKSGTRDTTRILLLVVIVCLGTGCGSRIIRSNEIPQEMLAKPPVNMAAFDISSLGVSNVQSDALYAGDLVQCSIYTGMEETPETWAARVSQNGALTMPYVGEINVANKSIASAESYIRQVSMERQVYRDPQVSISIKNRLRNRVEVIGAVREPGTYELPVQDCNLVAALSAAGGFLPTASETIEVHRSNEAIRQPLQLNLPQLKNEESPNLFLGDGAVVHVPLRPREVVHVFGNAKSNRTVELSPEYPTRLLDVLAEVGGLRYSNWICDKVDVTRNSADSPDKKHMIRLSIKEARENETENILIAGGDIIHVKENALTFSLNTLGGLMGVGTTAARFAIP